MINTIKAWGNLQFLCAIIGLVPLLAGTYGLALLLKINVTPAVVVLIALTSWMTIASIHVKAVLNALLQFKLSATLEFVDSMTRAITWLCVAFYMNSSLGLALAQLTTACVTSSLSMIFLWLGTRHYKEGTIYPSKKIITHDMIVSSGEYVWLG